MSDLAENPAGHVCLTFDFDGPSLWIQRGQTTPAPISRGEFGAVAVPRILKLLERRGLPSTFFVPGHTVDTYPDVCRMIVDAGCEIGLHGYTHEYNPRLSDTEEREVMARSFEIVDRLWGRPPRGYRAPSGDVTPRTLELLIEYGVTYDSSLMGHDHRPYFVRSGDRYPDDGPVEFGVETELVELPFSWTLDDYVHLEFVTFKRSLMPGLQRPEDMFANFAADVRWMVREVRSGVCTVTFHPQAIGRGGRLLAMEAWLDEIAELGVSFARMDTVADAFLAGQPLGVEA